MEIKDTGRSTSITDKNGDLVVAKVYEVTETISVTKEITMEALEAQKSVLQVQIDQIDITLGEIKKV